MHSLLSLLVGLTVLFSTAPAGAEEVETLVRRADHALRGKTTAALMTMRVHTKSFDRSYSMVYWADERAGSRALVKILGPARWRGHGTLKVGGRLSLYDPSNDKITVLSSSMLGDSWMGSHFTNDDLVKETDLAKDYRSKLLKTWAKGDARFYRVRLTPTPRAPVAWDHIVVEMFEQSSDVIPTRQEYYKRANAAKPTRVLTLSDVQEMSGRRVPTKLVIRVASKPGEYTELRYKKLKFDSKIPADKFSERALRN
ncbi:MAG: outer membrane lipoprotein-sorting protein [Polyangiaceae bacterium]